LVKISPVIALGSEGRLIPVGGEAGGGYPVARADVVESIATEPMRIPTIEAVRMAMGFMRGSPFPAVIITGARGEMHPERPARARAEREAYVSALAA
jgi:hypothetical protein